MALPGGRGFLEPGVVAMQGHQVVDAEIIQFDQGVLGLATGEAVAEQVWNRLYPEAPFDGGTDPNRAGAFALHVSSPRAIGHLFVVCLCRVAGDVDERRVERHQVLDDSHDLACRTTALGRDDLVRNKWFGGAFQEFCYFHAAFFLR